MSQLFILANLFYNCLPSGDVFISKIYATTVPYLVIELL